MANSLSKLNPAEGLISAKRCLPRHNAKASNAASALGLVYERKVVAALATAFSPFGFDLSHNPWFEFSGKFGHGCCSPDILVAPQSGPWENMTFCVEVKLTWVPEALDKLLNLYCPVVSMALGSPVFPLVVCKNLAAGAPKAQHSFGEAVSAEAPSPLLQWLGSRPIVI